MFYEWIITSKEKSQNVLVKCLDIMSNHYVKLAGHIQNLVGQCLMTDCYFQQWLLPCFCGITPQG